MGRNKKNSSEMLVNFAREYFETEGNGDVCKLKCSNFARYAEKHGSDAKAYDFRRDKAVSDFIDEMKKRIDGVDDVTAKAYRTLDIDAMLLKSRNINDFKTCIRELDEYWKAVYDSALKTEAELNRLKSMKAKSKEVEDLKDKTIALEVRIKELERDNRRLTEACRYMRKVLKKYLYPAVANELLRQEKMPVEENKDVRPEAFDELIEAKFPEAFKGKQGIVKDCESRQEKLFKVMEAQVGDGIK